MSTRKLEIINRIRALLNPQEVLSTFFIQSETEPGKWTRNGEVFTLEQAQAVKARRKYFITIARRKDRKIPGQSGWE